MKLNKGYVQIYTGNGKGKTTAAIGLAIRALGAGLKVAMFQFMKDFAYSELKILDQLGANFYLERFGDDRFVFEKKEPPEKLRAEMTAGLERAKQKMLSRQFDLIILDEALVSIYFKLFTENDIIHFIKNKPEPVELILTGRYCPDAIIELADLVTTMHETRHYYQKGVLSRIGIDA